MRVLLFRVISVVICIVLALGASSARAQTAAPCGGDFATWLNGTKTEAAAAGISQRTLQSALANVTPDPTVVARDHAQGVF
jgi:membrane-bound lytic murein transglycosylase B